MEDASWSFGALPAEPSPPVVPRRSPDAGSSRPLSVGAQLGPYRLLEPLGQGAMGAVFRAHDSRLDREVAIKVILERRFSEQARARFEREAKALAALRHPGIVAMHDLGEDQGRLYLAFELVPGARSWGEVWPELPRKEALRLLLEVARALGHVHAQGIVHRDLKPSNILVGADGRPFLTDFGLATSDRFDRLTQSGALVGTPTTMSPEQLRGDRDAVGPASDVWGLGVVLYQTLTGELPFQADTLPGLVVAIDEGRYVPPRRLDRTISSALANVIERALRCDPRRRYADGAALAAALAAAIDQGGARRRRLSRGVVPLVALLGAVVVALALTRTKSLTPSPSITPEPAVAATSGDLDEQLRRVDRHEEAGEWGAALEILAEALKAAPRDATLWSRRARVYTGARQPDQAQSDLDHALELDPDEPEVWRVLVFAQLSRGQNAAALTSSWQLITIAPDEASSWNLRGESLRRAGRLSDALEALRRALVLEPDSAPILNNLAAVILEQDEAPGEAEALLRRVTRLEPSQPEPWRNLALLFMGRDDPDEALKILEEAARYSSGAELFHTRAEIRKRGGDLEGALADAELAVGSRPDWAEALALRAQLLQETGRVVRARGDVVRLLETALATCARRDLEIVLEVATQQEDTRLRIRVLEAVVALDDQDATAWNTLAVLREREGDMEGALWAYDRAIALRGDDPAIRFNRGELHHQLGNLSDALRDLRLAEASLDPTETRALEGVAAMIADIEARLGQGD